MGAGAFPPITTRQSFGDIVEIVDADTGDALDLTGCTIQVELAPAGYCYMPDYGRFTSSRAPGLLATTADGSVAIPDLGIFVYTFTPAQIATLCPGQYVIAANIARDEITRPLFSGTLSVLDGVLPQ